MDNDNYTNLILGVVASIIAALLIPLFPKLCIFIRKLFPDLLPDPDPPSEADQPDKRVHFTFSENSSIIEKIKLLEEARKDFKEQSIILQRRGANASGLALKIKEATMDLYDMYFLAKGDRLDDRYDLIEKIGDGQTSVVWKAFDNDEKRQREVAIKLLKYKYANDKSTIKCFSNGAKTMENLGSSANIPNILEMHNKPNTGASTKLHYYVMDFIQGVCLTKYISEHPKEKIKIVEALLQIAECLKDAHKKNFIHRDIKPNNILIVEDEDKLILKLVDFDAVSHLIDCYDTPPGIGTFGYSAPEVLNKHHEHKFSADVFSLARVIMYIYYNSELPCPYEMSNKGIIDFLDCTPIMKKTLESATDSVPSERYQTMDIFINALKEALVSEKTKPPLFSVLKQEKDKVYKILLHSFLGTLSTMLITRSLLTEFGSFVHLSDRLPVAIFHGVIGSFVWGVFISGAFLCYFIKFRRNDIWGYLLAMSICGLSGFLGGVICATPSVFVTNVDTLQILGWLPDPSIIPSSNQGRLWQTAVKTKMLWSFPLVGLFTGAGLGLCLNFKTHDLLMKKISGITPIPVKNIKLDKYPFRSSFKFVCSSPLVHLFLLFPVIFSVSLQFLFEASPHMYPDLFNRIPNLPDNSKIYVPELVDLLVKWKGVLIYQEFWRSIGEGFAHYLGALGLTIGFFWGVPKYLDEKGQI